MAKLKEKLEKYSKGEKQYIIYIGDWLKEEIKKDKYLCEKVETTDKTLEGCYNYLKQEAKKVAENGCACFSDKQGFEMVKHYLLEDDLNCEPKEKEVKTNTAKAKTKSDISNNLDKLLDDIKDIEEEDIEEEDIEEEKIKAKPKKEDKQQDLLSLLEELDELDEIDI